MFVIAFAFKCIQYVYILCYKCVQYIIYCVINVHNMCIYCTLKHGHITASCLYSVTDYTPLSFQPKEKFFR